MARNGENGDRVFATESYNGRDAWLSEITDGERRDRPIVDNIPVKPGYVGQTPIDSWPLEWQKFALGNCVKDWQEVDLARNAHYLAISELGQVMDVTDMEGDYMELIKNKPCLSA